MVNLKKVGNFMSKKDKIAINKFYKETENGFEPISKEEYDMCTSAANSDL